MVKVKEFVGIDISKLTFDVATPTGTERLYKHSKYENSKAGFTSLKEKLPSDCICVMEASGPYYMGLANYLHGEGIEVRVVNPLAVKHFSRMRMTRAKTDKKDAALIAEYAKSENPPIWKPKAEHLVELQQLQSVLEGSVTRKTQLQNQYEALLSSGLKKSSALGILKKEISHVISVIEKIEKQMENIAQAYHKEMFKRLQSIPGIGKRTAMLLIVITDGFTRFETAKQLVGYVGLCPRIYDSGTSVKGKQKICKMGMASMRTLLYMCAMTAKQSNHACAEMHIRLKAKGKNGKLILVAIANKLIKQAFAIAKSGQNYESKLFI
ncbi:MAG TPA: IS110 family transposase [Chitinophagales bacterium]|nr:IS110 family transposase [Chitinophagales bacterium]